MKAFDADAIDCSNHDAVMDTFKAYEDDIDAIELNAQGAVRRAYLCEKPLAEVELGNRTDQQTVGAFANEMSEWFYTCVRESDAELDGETVTVYSVYLTRFSGVVDVVRGFVEQDEPIPHDIRGILFGYDTTDVAGFCEQSAPDVLR